MALARLAATALVAGAAWAEGISSAAPAAPHGSAAAAQGQAAGAAKESSASPESIDWMLVKGLLWAWIALVGGTIIYCGALHAVAYMRTIACLNNNTQKYFTLPNYFHSDFRKYLVDSPLFRKRHHREFKLSSAVNMGTLPNRAQMLFLIGYVAASVVLTVIDINWSDPSAKIYSLLVSRTGMMAIMNMIPLFLLAGRNNPLIQLTGITFDTYNLIHRWLGRIVVIEAILHGVFWTVNKIQTKGKSNTLIHFTTF
jgi:hypothetical protein